MRLHGLRMVGIDFLFRGIVMQKRFRKEYDVERIETVNVKQDLLRWNNHEIHHQILRFSTLNIYVLCEFTFV